jgi:glucans biosynthesis protein
MGGFLLNRRHVVAGLAVTAVASRALAAVPARVLGDPEPFSFDALVAEARRLASEPHRTPSTADPAILDRLDYDAVWKIAFRNDASLTVGGLPLQFFHVGKFAREGVRMHILEGGASRVVHYSRDFFTMPDDSPARELTGDPGFAGFRIMRPDMKPDWISFLGASYFRCDGPEMQYGLSARGLAVNTGLATPEEFPRFSDFWIGDAERPDEEAVVYALLQSASVTGAYRFGVGRGDLEGDAGEPQHQNVECRLFFRNAVERVGIAPLTSMFWYSETNRPIGDDWRPEIHDSDGLSLHLSSGERLWRPLRNPRAVSATSFFDGNVRGFGLIQRDRAFENYQDDGVFYNRRPSVWVVPQGDWGDGAVQLVEIPTGDETFDNIVAYWTPATQPVAGTEFSFDYRLEWRERDPLPSVAHTVNTFRGQGGIPGQPIPPGLQKYVIDFAGGPLDGVPKEEGALEVSIDARPGRVIRPAIRPVVGTDRWRVSFDLEGATAAPVELRVYAHRGGEPVTETWTLLAEG